MTKYLMTCVLFIAAGMTGAAAWNNRQTDVAPAASSVRAFGMTTGTDYGPHNNMAEAAAVETLRRQMGGINAMEPIQLR